MKVEICDLCHKRVGLYNSTRVIIKDYNAVDIDGYLRKRKFEGVICDNCLKLLREKVKEASENE